MKHSGRFFARILAADISCPDCGEVHSLSLNKSGSYWDKRVSKFKCTKCGKSWILGVLAWKPKLGNTTVTMDQTPNREEARALREERWITGQGLVMEGKLDFSKDYANMAARASCLCPSEDCPIHVT